MGRKIRIDLVFLVCGECSFDHKCRALHVERFEKRHIVFVIAFIAIAGVHAIALLRQHRQMAQVYAVILLHQFTIDSAAAFHPGHEGARFTIGGRLDVGHVQRIELIAVVLPTIDIIPSNHQPRLSRTYIIEALRIKWLSGAILGHATG